MDNLEELGGCGCFHRKMTDILEEFYMKFKSNVKQTGLRGIGLSISPVDRFFKSLDFRG